MTSLAVYPSFAPKINEQSGWATHMALCTSMSALKSFPTLSFRVPNPYFRYFAANSTTSAGETIGVRTIEKRIYVDNRDGFISLSNDKN